MAGLLAPLLAHRAQTPIRLRGDEAITRARVPQRASYIPLYGSDAVNRKHMRSRTCCCESADSRPSGINEVGSAWVALMAAVSICVIAPVMSPRRMPVASWSTITPCRVRPSVQLMAYCG